jgi:hypothetical protein
MPPFLRFSVSEDMESAGILYGSGAFLGRGKIFPFFSLQHRFSVVIYESEEENDPTEEELL